MTSRIPAKGRGAPFVFAALSSSVLLAYALVIHETVENAADVTTRGIGGTLHAAALEAISTAGEWPPSRSTLARLVASGSGEHLRHVAVLGDDGRVLVEAGEPGWHPPGEWREGDLERVGDYARMVLHVPHWLARPGPVEPDGSSPSAGLQRGWHIVYEFKPLAAIALDAQAHELLLAVGVSCAGMLALAYAVSRSLSRRAALEAELERERRLAALGSMSAVLAHEIRNPLTSLKGHAQLLAETVERDARLSPSAERVVSEAVRLERLIEDLLTFVQSGELRRTRADANDALRAAVAAVGDARVDAQYTKGTSWSVDAERIGQALENVIRNALQASPPAAPVEARVLTSDGMLVYVVRDHGPGIPAGEERRIFEPFVTGRVRGVGLGLAITRRIVDLHGGTVTASNRPEGGAEFRISLPDAREA